MADPTEAYWLAELDRIRTLVPARRKSLGLIFYESCARPILFLLPEEPAHHLAIWTIRVGLDRLFLPWWLRAWPRRMALWLRRRVAEDRR